MPQVDGDAQLGAVDLVEGGHGVVWPRVVGLLGVEGYVAYRSAPGQLDLDYLGPELAQHPGGHRPGYYVGEVDDPHMMQGQRASLSV